MNFVLTFVAFTLVCHSTALRTSPAAEANETGTKCQSCSLVNLDKTFSLTWTVFPPYPVPGYSLSFFCSPRTLDWDEDPEVDTVLEKGCGLDDKDADELGGDNEKCNQQAAATKKRAAYLGIKPTYLRQLVVCGRCTVCTVFEKVRNLWKKIKAAVQKVVDKLRSVKTALFGYSYAPAFVRSEMQQRFDGFFPEDDGSARSSSLLQEDEHEITEEKVEKALHDHLAGKPDKFVQNHLSLLQRNLEEVEQHEEELMRDAMRRLRDQTQKSQQMFEQKLPEIINNKHCQEALGTSATGSSLTSTLTVSFPNVASAILNAVLLNFAGALYALIPGVYISATPHGFESVGSVDRCLEALQKNQLPLLDSCAQEQPLMACTTRTYQRIMENALSEQWWPLMHNSEGTFGSIDLGYKYDELMNSLRCSSKGSCVEKGLDHLGKDNLKEILENNSAKEADRLNEMQCSFAANRVDSEDQQTATSGYTLPVFTDKIWAVALKAHGATFGDVQDINKPCPDILPWVVAFCATEFSCMDTSSSDLQVAQARAAETVAPLQESLGSKSLSEAQKEAFAEKWQTLVHSKFDGLDDEEDAFQWSLLWHMANATSSAGLMSSWPEILEALSGKRTIDWSSTRLHWEKVLFTALLRLQIREVHSHDPTDVQDERSLSQVFLNLQSIYETKICSPGALGGLKDEHLRRLGVGKEDLVQLALHQIDKEEVIKGLWRNWMVLHVQVPSSKKHFLKALRESKCRCMCYEACGKFNLHPSAAANCQEIAHPANITAHQEKWTRIKEIRVKRAVIDRIGLPAHQVLTNAVYLKILRKKTISGCSSQLEVRSRYSQPLRGFISACSVPEYFEQSEDLGLTITLWTDPRHEKLYGYDDFLRLHRPYRTWQDAAFGDEDDEDDYLNDDHDSDEVTDLDIENLDLDFDTEEQ